MAVRRMSRAYASRQPLFLALQEEDIEAMRYDYAPAFGPQSIELGQPCVALEGSSGLRSLRFLLR